MSIKFDDLFKQNRTKKPVFDANENWLAIQNKLRKKSRIKYIYLSAAAMITIVISTYLFSSGKSDLYSDNRFAEIIRLEQQLELELTGIEIDSSLLESDYRLKIVLIELEHINEQIQECKKEIDQNPYNPNYHKALFALYKSKRRMVELIKNRG